MRHRVAGRMRVIAGALKGRRLKTPTWDGLRPTSDKLRETLFNMLAPRIAGARVLDGYAGTGAVGIEALSRGAAHVDVRRAATGAPQALIAENLAHCGVADGYAIIRAQRRAARSQRWPPIAPFDIILLDPPYDDPSCRRRLRRPRGDVAGAGRPGRARARAAATGRRNVGRAGAHARRWRRATARWRSTTHADHRCHARGLSRVVRSADQRPRRHHHARRAPLRSHHRRDAGERREDAALHDGRARRDRARGVQGQPNVEVDTFDGLLVDYVERRERAGDRPRAARRVGLRVRVPDGADEPAARTARSRPSS